MGTTITTKFSSFPNSTDISSVVTSGVEIPDPPPAGKIWGPGRGTIDIAASSIRMTITSPGGATYGPGASFTFSNLAPKDAAGCVLKVAGVSYTTNKSVALSQVIAQSSFTATSVTMGFQNQTLYADWQPGEYIEAQLKFTPCLVSTPTYGTLPVSVANPACGPWKICFRVDVPNSVGANGTAQVNLQIYQNGLPVGPLLTPVAGAPATTTTNPMTQDGIICFQVPLSAPYLNPALGGFDYVATTNYTLPGNTTLTPTVIGSQPQGVVQGLNNDVKYDPRSCTDSTASTCCPPLDKVSLGGLFDHFGNSNLTYQMGAYLPATVANRAAFLAGYKAYLAYLKLICPTVAGLSVTFTLGTALGSGLLITPIPGATSTFLVTPSTPLTVPPMFANALNNNSWYGIYANTVAVNALGQTVNCGFDAKSCDRTDRFTFNYQTGGKIAGGASPFILGE